MRPGNGTFSKSRLTLISGGRPTGRVSRCVQWRTVTKTLSTGLEVRSPALVLGRDVEEGRQGLGVPGQTGDGGGVFDRVFSGEDLDCRPSRRLRFGMIDVLQARK